MQWVVFWFSLSDCLRVCLSICLSVYGPFTSETNEWMNEWMKPLKTPQSQSPIFHDPTRTLTMTLHFEINGRQCGKLETLMGHCLHLPGCIWHFYWRSMVRRISDVGRKSELRHIQPESEKKVRSGWIFITNFRDSVCKWKSKIGRNLVKLPTRSCVLFLTHGV